MSRDEKVFHDFFETAYHSKYEGKEPLNANSFSLKVEKKAHELYLKRGSQHGHDWDDWFAAEKAMEAKIDTVEKDCIRSESCFETFHQSSPLPSYIDPRKMNK